MPAAITGSAALRPDGGEFIRLLAPGVAAAARLARSLEGAVANVPKQHETRLAKQALTEADTRAQECLLAALLEHFPRVCVAAEEDTPTVACFPDKGDARVVIDPIDGTLHSYLEAKGPYAVMVGLVVRGRYEAGLVALPREGMLFAAARGEGVFRARPGGPLQPARLQTGGTRILVSHELPAPCVAWLERAGCEVVPACGGAIAIAPLIPGVRAGLRVSQTAGVGISIRGRIGVLLAVLAGGVARGDGGMDFPLDDTTPAATLRVSAREADQKLLADALAAGDIE